MIAAAVIPAFNEAASIATVVQGVERSVARVIATTARHLANAALRGKIEETCRVAGTVPPIICTPEELMEAES